jgi:hypothetical protein
MQPRKPNLVREIMVTIDLAIVLTGKLTQLVKAETKLLVAIAAFVIAVIKIIDLLK